MNRILHTIIAILLAAHASAAAAFIGQDGANTGVTAIAETRTESDLATFQGCPSLSQAVERVRRQNNGRIVSAETQVRADREVHVIKVLTDGRQGPDHPGQRLPTLNGDRPCDC